MFINKTPGVITLAAMTNDKQQILKMLKDVYNRWEELLAGMSEEQVTNPDLPSGLSVKDVVAHLWAWQERSVARQEAAVRDREPAYPGWPEAFDPDPDE